MVNFAAEIHVDRSIDGPRRLHPHQRRRHLQPARSLPRGYWCGSAAAIRNRTETFRFLHVSTDEVYGSLGADRAVHRDDALRAQLALLRLQGRQRPPRARLSSHLRAAGAHHQLLQQLRPLPVSREADPADDPQRAWRGKPLPVYGDGDNVRDWLYVDGPLPGHAAACCRRGTPGETYNIGGHSEQTNLAGGRHDLRTWSTSCAATPPHGRRCGADRPSSRIAPATTAATPSTPTKIQRGARLASRARDLRVGHGADRPMVPGEHTRLVPSGSLRGGIPPANGLGHRTDAGRRIATMPSHRERDHPGRRHRHAAVPARPWRSASSCCRSTTSR